MYKEKVRDLKFLLLAVYDCLVETLALASSLGSLGAIASASM